MNIISYIRRYMRINHKINRLCKCFADNVPEAEAYITIGHIGDRLRLLPEWKREDVLDRLIKVFENAAH